MEYDKKHWTPEGFNIDGSRTYKAKRGFDTELRAQYECFKRNIKPEAIHKLVAYKCPICSRWHIGHNNTLLEDKDKKKIQKQFNEWKIIHDIR